MKLIAMTLAFGLLLAMPADAVEFPPQLAANSLDLSFQFDRIYIDLDTGEAITQYQSNLSTPNFNTDPPTFSTDPPVWTERRLRKTETNQLKALLRASLESGVDAPKTCRTPDHRVLRLQASVGKLQFSNFVFCPLPATERLMSAVWSVTHPKSPTR